MSERGVVMGVGGWVCVGVFGGCTGFFGYQVVRCWLDDRDRRRLIAERRQQERLLDEQARDAWKAWNAEVDRWDAEVDRLLSNWKVWQEQEELGRLRSGAAWADAMALQLEEIRSLPEIEPDRGWVW